MNKTCYFCEKFYLFNCTNPKHNHSNQACDDNFTPNADWLYIEKLEKENEELKKQLEFAKNQKRSKALDDVDIMFTRFGNEVNP